MRRNRRTGALRQRTATPLDDLEAAVESRIANALMQAAVERWESLVEAGAEADLGSVFRGARDIALEI